MAFRLTKTPFIFPHTTSSTLRSLLAKVKMEDHATSVGIIQQKIEDLVRKNDLAAAVVQCDELEILASLAKKCWKSADFIFLRSPALLPCTRTAVFSATLR